MEDNKVSNNKNNFLYRMKINNPAIGFLIMKIKFIVAIIIVVAVIVAAFWFLNRNDKVAIENDDRMELSPSEIRSIEKIGQWEFLSLNDEELVDTVRHGFFGDDELVRIYYGTLRLGIDMQDVDKNWITTDKDTIVCVLPKVRLLDKKFIDEAQTKSFFETGSWSADDRENMYNRAYKAMLQRCLTKENMKRAEENAKNQFTNLISSMGFENVKVSFANTNTTK